MAWTVAVACVSTLVRVLIVRDVPSAWILPDETVYSELAKSIAAGERPSVRGIPVFGWGEAYPGLIAPAWALFEDPTRAYHAALATNALVMSSAAVPAYFLARLFVSPKASFVVALMTVLVPSMAYTGVVMTENAFYPIFLIAVLLIARAVRSPVIGNQAWALLGLGVVAVTRIQGVALMAAYAGAVAIYAATGPRPDLRAYIRRFIPTALMIVPLTLMPFVLSLARGDGLLGWLGVRSGTLKGFRASEVPEWFAFLSADLVLYVAVGPAAATALVIGTGLSKRAHEPVRLFVAVALPVCVAMLASVAIVSASFDVDGTENLNERYVFYVVPILFVGLAVWVQSGLPRSWSWAIVAGCCLLTVSLPVDRLEYNAEFQSLALVPWIGLELNGVGVATALGLFTLACGVLWATCRADRIGRLWLLTATWMVLLGVVAVGANRESATQAAAAFEGKTATWVDDRVPRGDHVAIVWDQRTARRTTPDPFAFWIMAAEIYNSTLGDVYRIGPPTYYEAFLPTIPVRVGPDRALSDASGRVVTAQHALVTCRAPVVGSVVAQAPRGSLRLIEVEGPLRLSTENVCSRTAP